MVSKQYPNVDPHVLVDGFSGEPDSFRFVSEHDVDRPALPRGGQPAPAGARGNHSS
jgi:hypothetical protein